MGGGALSRDWVHKHLFLSCARWCSWWNRKWLRSDPIGPALTNPAPAATWSATRRSCSSVIGCLFGAEAALSSTDQDSSSNESENVTILRFQTRIYEFASHWFCCGLILKPKYLKLEFGICFCSSWFDLESKVFEALLDWHHDWNR